MGRVILADENIPLLEECFGPLGTVRAVPGQAITARAVREADVLLVRSVTRVDAALLDGSRVRFVGSATIGTDHVDRAYLRRAGIAFAHAPGSNADSVVEYVLAALCCLARRHGVSLAGRTVGIVGCGNVGGRLARRLPALGFSLRRHDPPLAEAEERAGRPHSYVGLEEVLASDIVTLHVPLVTTGAHPTRHLIGRRELERVGASAWLINTSRGAVVDNRALREALEAGRPGACVLDVWEGEPRPDRALVEAVSLATPHIAGYSVDGKERGSRMIHEALCRHLGLDAPAPSPGEGAPRRLLPPDPALPEAEWLDAVVRQMYDVEADDARFREGLRAEDPGRHFTLLRKHYPPRRTFGRHALPVDGLPAERIRAVREGLGVRALYER